MVQPHELRQRRESLGLSRKALASLTHLSPETIRKYERGSRTISAASARVLEQVLWGDDKGRALRMPAVYSLVTDGAMPEEIYWAGVWREQPTLEDARKLAQEKADELGRSVQIVLWRDRELVEIVKPRGRR